MFVDPKDLKTTQIRFLPHEDKTPIFINGVKIKTKEECIIEQYTQYFEKQSVIEKFDDFYDKEYNK